MVVKRFFKISSIYFRKTLFRFYVEHIKGY
ncbi:hypothetical protein [Escherichia phage pEC-M719-6WT.1]|uniref:Uncharacterized protein n=1 Tax=Escherichia phage pEC-M719-6WT.1 TaxID=3056220 RepID=A0AA51U7T2_9CAUD|nr:hypothetical protein [Escherichia phage pEC-M719-6WT.1]